MDTKELKSTLKHIHRVLKEKGKLIYTANWGQQDLYPQHYNHKDTFVDYCHQLGFVDISPLEMMKVK